MNQYRHFAEEYDRFMCDADYPARTERLCELFEAYDRMPKLLLDVGCGTGGFSLAFAEKGVEVIGVDPSEEMLSVAREKALRQNQGILFLCQSGETMDLYGTVDGAVCCMDTVNHVLHKRDLLAFFRRVSLFLEPGRLFLFDVNTPYKHRTVLGNKTFVLEDEDGMCVWQNAYDGRGVTDMQLDFFTREGDAYRRRTEQIAERAYTKNELTQLLSKAHLRVLTVEGEWHKRLSPCEQRWIFVTKRD